MYDFCKYNYISLQRKGEREKTERKIETETERETERIRKNNLSSGGHSVSTAPNNHVPQRDDASPGCSQPHVIVEYESNTPICEAH